eukprot:1019475-Pelagomonas_calceolata.AAC.3
MSYKARKAYAGPLLQSYLGPGFSVPGLTENKSSRHQSAAGMETSNNNDGGTPGGVRLVNREDVGTHVHIFSHIRQVLGRANYLSLSSSCVFVTSFQLTAILFA